MTTRCGRGDPSRALLDYLSEHLDDMVADLRHLVEIESPTDDPAAVNGAVEWLAGVFSDQGAQGPQGAPDARGVPGFSVKVERVPAHPSHSSAQLTYPSRPPASTRPAADHLLVRLRPLPAEPGDDADAHPGDPDDPGRPSDSADPGDPGDRPDERQILLLGHVDTVWPVGTLEKRPFRVEGDTAYGPGCYDMKSGLVVALWALRALGALGRRLRRPVTLLVNTDEETGSNTSRAAIEEEAKRSAAALVLEPALPDGAVKTWRKGVGHFRVEVRGRAAHAGAEPEKGVSAVGEMAHQVLRLHDLTDLETGTTVNVGVIGGGSRSNVVAEAAWAEVDVRVMSREEAGRIEKIIRGLEPVLSGARLTVTGGIERLPMERSEGALILYEKARRVAADLGFDLKETGTGGASDGNFTSALGIPTLDGLGAAGDGAHAEHEQVDLKTLPLRASLLAGLIEAI